MEDAQQAQNNKLSALLLAFLALLLLAVAYVLARALNLTDIHRLATFIIGWGAWGPVVIILLGIIAALTGVIPSYPLTILAGAIWGVWEGALYALIGLQVGATISFLIARHAAFPWLEDLLGKHLRLYRRIDDTYITRFVFLSRLLPIFVFELISYGAGLTNIKFWHYFWATLIGSIPMTLLLAWSAETAVAETNPAIIALTLVALALMLAFPYIVEKHNPLGIKERLLREDTQ